MGFVSCSGARSHSLRPSTPGVSFSGWAEASSEEDSLAQVEPSLTLKPLIVVHGSPRNISGTNDSASPPGVIKGRPATTIRRQPRCRAKPLPSARPKSSPAPRLQVPIPDPPLLPLSSTTSTSSTQTNLSPPAPPREHVAEVAPATDRVRSLTCRLKAFSPYSAQQRGQSRNILKGIGGSHFNPLSIWAGPVGQLPAQPLHHLGQQSPLLPSSCKARVKTFTKLKRGSTLCPQRRRAWADPSTYGCSFHTSTCMSCFSHLRGSRPGRNEHGWGGSAEGKKRKTWSKTIPRTALPRHRAVEGLSIMDSMLIYHPQVGKSAVDAELCLDSRDGGSMSRTESRNSMASTRSSLVESYFSGPLGSVDVTVPAPVVKWNDDDGEEYDNYDMGMDLLPPVQRRRSSGRRGVESMEAAEIHPPTEGRLRPGAAGKDGARSRMDMGSFDRPLQTGLAQFVPIAEDSEHSEN